MNVHVVVSPKHPKCDSRLRQQSEKGLASASGKTGIAGLMMSSATLLNEGLQEELDTTAWGRAISGTPWGGLGGMKSCCG